MWWYLWYFLVLKMVKMLSIDVFILIKVKT